MESCNHGSIFELGDGYSLCLFSENTYEDLLAPTPVARSFELAEDELHYAPERPADVKHVKLVIALDFEQEMVSGTVYTTFSALYEELRTVSLDAVDLHIERVTVESGQELEFSNDGEKLFVTLDRVYSYGEEFTVAVEYHAKPRTGLHFVKPGPDDPTRPVQAWSFGQPRYHRYWFPCHDEPNDRATTEIIVTVPAQFLTVSNGNLLSVTDNGPTKTHHWRFDVPQAAYLISLVVGDFAIIEDTYNGKPVTYYVCKDRKDDARLLMGKTPDMMAFFSEYTGVEYPYDKYAQTVVELYTGAMEHTTTTTHGFMLLMDKRAALDIDMERVVAHELAHQWFGDLVTCRDWANGWLNEGFATYFEEMWSGHDKGNDYFKYSMLNMKKTYLREDQQYRRPIVYHVYSDQGAELFDAHMYQKGAWVLHMLRHQLGEAAFQRGIRRYIGRNREREVITADLERTLEEVTGRSLAQFFEQWVYRGGYPAFEVSYSWDGEHSLAKVKIKQTQKVDDLTPCFVTPVDLAFMVPSSDEAAKDEQTNKVRTVTMRVLVGEDREDGQQLEQSFYVPLEREPVMVRFDPEGWLLKTLRFERSGKMMRYQLAHDRDILGRIEAAEALGAKSDEESVKALQRALMNDSFWGVRVVAAAELGKIRSRQAQDVLLQALQELDLVEFSRVRAAIAMALGGFQVPQQAELAERSAQALAVLLEKGDISYLVEGATAEALGRTRTAGCVDALMRVGNRPSWNNRVQQSIFTGMGATGEDRVVDILASYLNNERNHITLRMAAAMGLLSVGRNRYLYSEEARQRAVTALCEAVEHDTWHRVRAFAAMALMALGEKRAIGVLERAARAELESRTRRYMRVALHALRAGDKTDEQLKQLRKDLDQVREENRKLKEQVEALEARMK